MNSTKKTPETLILVGFWSVFDKQAQYIVYFQEFEHNMSIYSQKVGSWEISPSSCLIFKFFSYSDTV